ncbi:Autotransporter beta-domain-containing protein [Novosphingobium sp. CF614]|uniref:autotransporter domain-containing protein n=1 Tax=Novosphingobium sp. CF614 TaxID=1884364 RepID=UPI0008DF1A5B|nr:autotransporter domain-containing protein [Novosphingobium sp. CF614]SFF85271.1 Autotransporter beta-domain-containing protein [Novosphingobium sp. CF614]
MHSITTSRQSLQRALLLGSVAGLALGSAQARAQAYGPEVPPTGAYLEAQSGSSGGNLIAIPAYQTAKVTPDPQIVVADPGDSDTSLDPTGINGVGQMVTDIGGGFIGLCTATLINPRTVVFAAHCVNDEAATDYGAASGGTPIGFGFAADTFSGVGNWYFGGYQTDTAGAFYNANYVAYNPGSLEPAAAQFLYSDVALASLDTPAADIPTWAMLFSPLPDPGTIGADGTGYHVGITGYGRSGSATTGSAFGIDFRRRSAENMIGALASLDQFEDFLFGPGAGVNPQNLYWIDFDDPLRGTAQASPFDFNAWRDNATPNEGTTASGDSGGPLILDDTYDVKVILGVLSGGYTRFFFGQPANGYGTASFYQPLYLYWDWIAANNPYHYASAKAGNGAWEDPQHWTSTLDPNYMVIDADGNLVNGVPTTPGEGATGNSGTFGQACFQTTAFSDCYDMATGTETVTGDPIGTATNDKAVGTLAGFDAVREAQASSEGAATLPSATLANGLPGATGFVPDNDDGDRTSATPPRYFDITLSAAGITTLASAVTIDRFTMTGPSAALDIAAGGSLTSLMSINQYAGMVRVNGSLSTNGDYFLLSGGLQGSGTINTPYFTNLAGVIAPGGIGTIGTLTFNGNLILSSGSTYLADIGAGGTSDLIRVQATTFDEGEGDGDGEVIGTALTPVDGIASLGGTVALGVVPGAMVRDGDAFSILTAEGGIEGEFDTATPISAILTPVLSYDAGTVTAVLEAGLYADVVAPGSPVQNAFAQLLDQNRVQYGTYAGLYGPLDLLSVAGVQGTLESFAPREQPLLQSMGTAALETNNRFIRDRLAMIVDGSQGGTLSYYGNPGRAMAAAGTSSGGGTDSASMAAANTGTPSATVENALPEDLSAFIAGGYIDGKSDGAPTAVPYAGDKFHGYYMAAGLEKSFDDSGSIGMALSYTMMKGQPGFAGRSVKGNLFQLSLYGAKRFKGGIGLDAQINAGSYDLKTARTVSVGETSWDLQAQDTPFTLTAEVGASALTSLAPAITVTPRIALRYSDIQFTRTKESGGGPALQYEMDDYESLQGRASLRIEGTGKIRPHLIGTFVHDFEDKPGFFGANFVGGTGPDALFALPGSDRDWAEVGVGLTTTGKVAFSLNAETVIWRSDLSYQSYRGAITISF